MTQQKDHKNLHQRLRDVMLIVKAINKETKKVNNQYTFVSHDSVAKALHDPMAENGIVMLPSVSELKQDGNRTVAKVDVTFVNVDDPKDSITVTYYGYGIDQQDKGVGKAISYAVKYCLLKMFCLETGDDVEKDNIDYKPETTSLTSDEIELIKMKCRGSKDALEYITKSAGGNLEKLKRDRFTGVIKWLDDPENKFFKKGETVEQQRIPQAV